MNREKSNSSLTSRKTPGAGGVGADLNADSDSGVDADAYADSGIDEAEKEETRQAKGL